ncbi:MAG: DUF3795 domain-containing protein [Acholeplasmataceae bacterium]|nr:DUF3795 domain-containing protein [Acholeplasmataceae bacterium]
MNIIAPCGIICDICLGFQTNKNKCVGCNNTGFKPVHCEKCNIKLCSEKNIKDNFFCVYCFDFPCKLIKHLDKRYKTKYNESPIQNLENIAKNGLEAFIEIENKKWTCIQCGTLLCVHRNECLKCGAKNKYFISHERIKK